MVSARTPPNWPIPRGQEMAAIVSERHRQILSEGWSPEHDDRHADGSLFRAAVVYFEHAIGGHVLLRDDGAPLSWPWEARWWKPKNKQRDLVRAGALCLAERDRVRRASPEAPIMVIQEQLDLIVATLAALPQEKPQL